jgi:hypothetical protein
MGSKNMMGPFANLQVKEDGREKRKSGRKYGIAYGKKLNLFYSLHLAHGGSGWPRGLHVAFVDLRHYVLPLELEKSTGEKFGPDSFTIDLKT